ncbi:DsbC family protein [Arcobacter sp.]|uniref:DsbC family protein n=1 Tax=unclassified Arcobacter TaxID=2593671 RepID=UPI003B00EE98|eukprot:TRINITY_DN2929_c1_g2_i1.p1 TRINITY_DN2929_c1_g2~~TRINITY_DN2929_c1_g2_i1.p1  ORF type:complete len:244 (+),score=-41.56 TRINITY_DN2929_c1_g2_i1:447-1178(+)
MKKIFKLMFLFTMLISLNVFATTELSKSEVNEIGKLPIFFGSGMKVLKAYKEDNFYLLRVNIQENIQELVLTADKKYLIAGKIYNVTSGEQVSIPNDVSILKDKEVLTYGTGNDVYYLFTDPECPYCKKFESYFDQIKNDVQFKIFFFPLSFHKNAIPLSKYVLSFKSNEDRVNALLNVTPTTKEFLSKKYTKVQDEALTNVIDAQMKLGEKLGVRGTPTLYDIHGKALSWVKVLERYGIEVK